MITSIATLNKSTLLADNTFELQFETEPSFVHEAGQFVTIKIPNTDSGASSATNPDANLTASSTTNSEPIVMRSYSISSISKSGHFELCVKKVENGRGSSYLSSLKEGEKVEFMGPFGHFIFKKDKTKNHILIGTGTGIAPLKSIIEDELQKGNDSPIHLLFGVRYVKDLFYKDLFAKLAAKNPNFTYEIIISRPENPSWEQNGGKIGRVTDLLKDLAIDTNNTDIYICGLKEMVLETTKMLEEKGIQKENINFERFN